MTHRQRLPLGLCAFGLPYTLGYVGDNPRPLSSLGLLDLAAELGLRWVELPAWREADLGRLRAHAAERDLDLVYGGRCLLEGQLHEDLALAAELGVQVVRCTSSTVLCGERARFGLPRWRELLAAHTQTLREAARQAADLGLRIGLENHQDATAEELVAVCERVNHPAIGITLDCGNALAVADDPLRFAQRVTPWLVDVHLKDYRVLRAVDGYHVAHCAIGDGVVDFAALWALWADLPDVPRSLELAAPGERRIRVLADDWWQGFPERDPTTLAPWLRLWREREEQDEWRTPWDSADRSSLAAWEQDRVRRSVANLAAMVRGETL